MTNLFLRLRREAGFSLIELLVAIAIIAILIGILLPGLGHARKVGRMTDEQARLHDTSVAYLAYANEYKEHFLPGYIHWQWSHPAPANAPAYLKSTDMRGRDFENRLLESYVSKVWPWRFATWVKHDMRGLVADKNLYSELMNRPPTPGGTLDPHTNLLNVSPGSTSREGGFAWHPSWGINGVYVGGHHMYGAFTNSAGYPGTIGPYGEFFVPRVSQVINATKLITMASSRRYDVQVQGFGSDDDSYVAAGTRVMPGSHVILPPYPFPTGRLSQNVNTGRGVAAYNGGGWGTEDGQSNKFDPRKRPSTWGFIDARHFDTACVATVDGHVEQLNLEQLRDSTRWANKATTKNWVPSPR